LNYLRKSCTKNTEFSFPKRSRHNSIKTKRTSTFNKRVGREKYAFTITMKFTSCLAYMSKSSAILEAAIKQSQDNLSELRILDLGAGNGMMGEALQNHGVSRLVGVDIIPEAYDATIRDRPGMYDAYYVEDFTKLTKQKREEIASWQCDCMVTVAALGFGDIPPKAFIEALNIVKNEAWVAFNIKETFFDIGDDSGFSRMIRELIFSKYLDVYYIERYRHRLSIDGEPLYYFAIAASKRFDVPDEFLESIGMV